MAELAARHTGTQAVIADTNLLVNPCIGKVILTLCHGTNNNTNALVLLKSLDILSHWNNGRIPAQRHLSAVWREVVRNGVFNDPEKLLGGGCAPDRELVQ